MERPSTISRLLRRLLAAAGIGVMVLTGLLVLAAAGIDSGPVPFALAVFLALTPVPLYLALVLRLDRFEPEPVRTIALVFFYGASVGTFVALVLNTLGEVIVGSSLGEDAAEIYGGSISAPIVEEAAKAAVIYGVYRWRRAEFNGVLDGIVYAGVVGLGFAMTENVLYYARGAVEAGLPGALATFVLRGVMSPFAHPVFTAATGIGLGIAVQTDRRWRRAVAPPAGLLVAMGLHSLWNTAAGAGLFFGVYVLIMVPVAFAILLLAAWARRREARVIRAALPHYVGRGVVRDTDIESLASIPRRQTELRMVRKKGGRRARRALCDVQLALTELAFHRDRAERGHHEGDARAADREAFWLKRLEQRRADLRAALPAP